MQICSVDVIFLLRTRPTQRVPRGYSAKLSLIRAPYTKQLAQSRRATSCCWLDGDHEQQKTLSYTDLGAGFVEITARRTELKGMEIGDSATGKVNETWDVLSGYLMAGAKSRVWPLW